MKTLEAMLSELESLRDEMIQATIETNSIPALSPLNGGDGEGKKADYLMTRAVGFDEVRRIDVPDSDHPGVMRPNILAVKKGKRKGTVWVIAHMDVVPAGDPELWDNPPFSPVYKDGKVYGRGTEDNGASIISTMFASRMFEGELPGMSLGVAWVADEETTSRYGIEYLLDHGFFSKDDIILVPDWGSPRGSMVEIAEKHILWLKVKIHGKTAHASSPNMGINAYRVSTVLLMDLMETFEERFGAKDERFRPPVSTFEPTRRPATVENVNTLPGYDEFELDVRMVPEYRLETVVDMVRELAAVYEKDTGARIEVEVTQAHESGRPSSTDTLAYRTLSDAIESVLGVPPTAVGVGGGTCANFFRLKDMDAYVWQCGGGTLHAPNEYVVVDNMMVDAKVLTTLWYKLCAQ